MELGGAADEIFGKVFLGFLHLSFCPLEGLLEIKRM